MGWSPLQTDASLTGSGERTGSEGGFILRDEEHDAGARITLEQCEWPPFALTCGLYGAMVHTTFASNEQEANRKYVEMKNGLDDLIVIWPLDDAPSDDRTRFYNAISAFVDRF